MPAITGAVTLSVGVTAVSLTNGGDFSPGGKFPRGGIIACPTANSGTTSLRHDGTATTAYPPIPKGDMSAGIPFTCEAINAGISLISTVAAQTVYVYPF